MFRVLTIATVIVLLATSRASAVGSDAAFSLAAVQTAVPPKLDGTLDDPVWQRAAHVQLTWDFSFQRAAHEPTDVYLLADSRNLYVAFVATQREPVTANGHTNDVPLGTDDVVRTFLWPEGDEGFEYYFVANPAGTRFSQSTENASFAPRWVAVAKPSANGYVVTEAIPLNVMRGDGRTTWKVQFDRRVRVTNQIFEWAHSGAQSGSDSIQYVGVLTGMTAPKSQTRAKPRLALYGLGAAATAGAGGSTSRLGADLAYPITPTASVLGTFHPDYSNVELDQQTIAPTAFARQFQEVRPFFVQGAQFYNQQNCNDCIDTPLLYTPAIPTPRDGYAVEGTQGLFNFGGFESLITGRTDSAQAISLHTRDRGSSIIYQSQQVFLPGTVDRAQYAQVILGNPHNFNVYATDGAERGTNVTDPSQGEYREYGFNVFTQKEGIFAAYHDIGAQYNPIDGFITNNGVAGPSAFAFREFDFSPHALLQSITVSQDLQRYHNRAGIANQTLSSTSLNFTTRNLYSLNMSSGSEYLLFGSNSGLANQNGISFAYGASTSTPTRISYNIGRFGDAYLRSTARSTTFKVTRLGSLTFEADNTNDTLDTGSKLVQWLERASFAYQITPSSSIALGARRIIGSGPPFLSTAQFVDASNVTFAYYRRTGPGEFYLVYGDPNALVTKPALVFKYIFYAGAQKGT